MWMRIKGELQCLIGNHIYRRVTHETSVYQYCPRCGRITWQYSHMTGPHLEMDAVTVSGEALRYRSLNY